MTTISGTAVGSPSGTTLQNLVDQLQSVLSDSAAAVWSEATLRGWLNDAIRDYSIHFRRQRTTTITTAANDREYDLPSDFVAVLSVEYPAGEAVPVYLQKRPFTSADFWDNSGYFDIVGRGDDQNASEVWISEKPAADQSIVVEYEAWHDWNLSASSYVTVPAVHHHILIAYGTWQASLNLQMAEQQSPTSNSSLLMSQFAQNSNMLRRQYLEALARAGKAQSGQGGVVDWGQSFIY